MKTLRRYIARTILQATGLVLLVFVGLQLLIMLIAQLNYIGEGNYGLWQAFRYILLDFPEQFYALFPVAALIGCLLGLGQLASNHELVVMRAAGVSTARITGAVLQAVCLLIFAMGILGEWVAPLSTHYANRYQAIDMSGGQALPTLRGLWLRDGNTYIVIEEVLNDGQLSGIKSYRFNNNHELVQAMRATSAQFNDSQWSLTNMRSTTFNGEHITRDQQSKATWAVKLNPKILLLNQQDSAAMTLKQLHTYIRYRRKNNLNTAVFELAFWQRVFKPLAILVMMLLAIPFVFGPLRQVSVGYRLMMGVVVGFGFHLFNQFFGPLSLVYRWPPIIAALLPIALCLVFGAWLLARRN
jgi:lipopolysaccharide export system permease protein